MTDPLQIFDASNRAREISKRDADLIPRVVLPTTIHFIDDVLATDSKRGGIGRVERKLILEVRVFQIHNGAIEQTFRIGPVGDGAGVVGRQGVAFRVGIHPMKPLVQRLVVHGLAVEIHIIVVRWIGLDAAEHVRSRILNGHLLQEVRKQDILTGAVDAAGVSGSIQTGIFQLDGFLAELSIEIGDVVVDIRPSELIGLEIPRTLSDAVFRVVQVVGNHIFGNHTHIKQQLAVVIGDVLKRGISTLRQNRHDPEFEEFDVVLGQIIQAARNHGRHASPRGFRALLEQVFKIGVVVVGATLGRVVPDIQRLHDVVLAKHIAIGKHVGNGDGQTFDRARRTGDSTQADGDGVPREFTAVIGAKNSRWDALVGAAI